jgi:predicted nuclease of restriction endonuclease-like (RecB) superfamily
MAGKKRKSALARSGLPTDYAPLLDSLKRRVREAQSNAVLLANRELTRLYWDIGRLIVERQEAEGWGQGIVDRLAADIQFAFPGISGFSTVNVSRMRMFYLAYRPGKSILSQPVTESRRENSAQAVPNLKKPNSAQAVLKRKRKPNSSQAVTNLENTPAPQPPESIMALPWGHNVVLLFKLKVPEQRLWYAAKAIEHGWSRAVMMVQIESDLISRQGKATTNFLATLPHPQSELALQSLKDPYVFDFLTLREDVLERDLETALMDHVQKFLLELGAGFAFVGRQVPLNIGDDPDFIDLLFYHLRLRCFVVIDLKMRKFTPEAAGKMNYYLSAVDDRMRHRDDAPTIGLILCKTHDRVKAGYALRDIRKPIGGAEWQTKLVNSLPKALESSLPSIEQIEAELAAEGVQ